MQSLCLYVVVVLAVSAEAAVNDKISLKNEAVLRNHVQEKRSISDLLQLLPVSRWISSGNADATSTEPSATETVEVSVVESVTQLPLDPVAEEVSAKEGHHQAKRSIEPILTVHRILDTPHRKLDQVLSSLPGARLLQRHLEAHHQNTVINLNNILKSVGLPPLNGNELHVKQQNVQIVKSVPVMTPKGIKFAPVLVAPFHPIPLITLVQKPPKPILAPVTLPPTPVLPTTLPSVIETTTSVPDLVPLSENLVVPITTPVPIPIPVVAVAAIEKPLTTETPLINISQNLTVSVPVNVEPRVPLTAGGNLKALTNATVGAVPVLVQLPPETVVVATEAPTAAPPLLPVLTEEALVVPTELTVATIPDDPTIAPISELTADIVTLPTVAVDPIPTVVVPNETALPIEGIADTV